MSPFLLNIVTNRASRKLRVTPRHRGAGQATPPHIQVYTFPYSCPETFLYKQVQTHQPTEGGIASSLLDTHQDRNVFIIRLRTHTAAADTHTHIHSVYIQCLDSDKDTRSAHTRCSADTSVQHKVRFVFLNKVNNGFYIPAYIHTNTPRNDIITLVADCSTLHKLLHLHVGRWDIVPN